MAAKMIKMIEKYDGADDFELASKYVGGFTEHQQHHSFQNSYFSPFTKLD